VRHWLGLNREVTAVFWAMLFHEAAYGSYASVWPLWIERLGAPITVVGFVLGSSGFVRLAILAPSAMLLERFGSRRPAVAARALATLGLVAAALATHWPQLFVTVFGMAAGDLVLPIGQAHVAAHAREQRVRAFTLVYTVGPAVALGIGPLATGAVVAVWGLRAAFVFAAVCAAVSAVAYTAIGHTPLAHAGGSRKSSYRDAFADGPVRRILPLMIGTIFALSLGTSFIPTFLHDVRGLASATVATLGAAAAIGTGVFGLAVTRLTWLQRAPLVAVAIEVSCVMAGLVILDRAAALWLIALAIVCRGGFLSTWTLFAGVLGEVASEAHRPRAFALGEMLGGVAFALAPMVAGPLYALHPSLPFAGAVLLACVLVPLTLRARRLSARTTQSAAPAAEAA